MRRIVGRLHNFSSSFSSSLLPSLFSVLLPSVWSLFLCRAENYSFDIFFVLFMSPRCTYIKSVDVCKCVTQPDDICFMLMGFRGFMWQARVKTIFTMLQKA